MPIAINGSGTITGITAGGLPDGCILDADINGMSSSKLSGALPAISGASLTNISTSGTAKVWVNFDGTGTPAISDSFNASSITDNGTGNYTVNFTTAMSNANYCVVQGSNNFGGNNNAVYLKVDNLTTSSFTVAIVASAVFVDRSIICMAVFGDQ